MNWQAYKFINWPKTANENELIGASKYPFQEDLLVRFSSGDYFHWLLLFFFKYIHI